MARFRIRGAFFTPLFLFFVLTQQTTQTQKQKLFDVTFCPFIRCTSDYLLELMYSGFSINTVDTEFRKKHQKHIWEESTGDQHNVILAKIDDRVGYGVFAAKDFEAGDFIVRYGGCLTAEGIFLFAICC